MAKVPLRMYVREIETLIERGNIDEATAHCRHILKTFPKYLECYRALGRAYLESKRFTEAADIFKRVLASVPDDFISHVGMSIISDDQKNQDETIWHMERAFETQPSNAAIQSELQRLYGRRDGREPHKIRLTRGALARMYVHGELYTQAISEIRSVLSEEPARMDMQVLLALAYFRSGQKVEASETCSQLISRYPYCLDANRILAEILPGTGMADNAQVYRTRVVELDPYASYAAGSIFQSGDIADNAVTIERLEYTGQRAEIPPSWERDAISASSAPALQPDWMKAPAQETPAAPPPPSAEPRDEQVAHADAASVPDWMRTSGWSESTGAFEEAATAEQAPDEGELAKADIPDWIKAMAPPAGEAAAPTPPPAAPSDENMDWLSKLGGDTSFAETPQESLPKSELPDWISESGKPEETPAAPAQGEAASASTLDWLADLQAKQPPEVETPQAAPAQGEAASASTLDWLADLQAEQPPEVEIPPATQEPIAPPSAPEPKPAEPPAPVSPAPSAPGFAIGDLGTSSSDQDAAMLWLESLAAKGGAKADELITNPQERPEKPPEWVEQARTIGESQPSAAETEAVPSEEAGLPSETAWASKEDTGAFGSAVAEEPSAGDMTSAWLRDLAEKEEAGAKEIQPPAWEEEPAPEEAQPPAWPHEEATPSAEELEPQPISDLPAWLRDLERREPLTPIASTEDMPDWLKETGPVEEEAAPQPTRPTDWTPETPKETLLKHAAPEIEPAAKPVSPELVGAAEPAQEIKPVPPPVSPEPVSAAKPAQEVKPVPPPIVPAVTPISSPAPRKKEVRKPEPAPAPVPASMPVDTRARRTGMLPPLVDPALASARDALAHGKIPDALQAYGNLIRKGKLLEDVTFDLKEALYRFPVEISIWQVLGDAYMRANRLQDALDAYTKAEELLR